MSTVKRIMIIDCQAAGISGDMLVGALMDLTTDERKVIDMMKSAGDYHKGCEKLEIDVEEVARSGLRAKKVTLKADEKDLVKTGAELRDTVERCAFGLGLSTEAQRFASDSVTTLVEAEAKAHGESVEKVNLHETGSVDTLVEIVGAATLIEELDLFRNTMIYSTPVAVGGGLFQFSHGVTQVPAPSTLEILRSRRFMVTGGPVESELSTPTGVSLLVNLAHLAARFYPPLKPTRIGYGAGLKDFASFPNILRIVVGEPIDFNLLMDEVYELETNLDDVSGEAVGHAVDKMLQEGAKDVCVIPMYTKKNRPGQIIRVIAGGDNVEYLSRVLIEETGTFGLRIRPCRRHVLARESIPMELSIAGVQEHVNVRIAKDRAGEIVRIKPEYDDVERLASKVGMPLREIEELVRIKARKALLEE